jgi:DNA topoisomerase-1
MSQYILKFQPNKDKKPIFFDKNMQRISQSESEKYPFVPPGYKAAVIYKNPVNNVYAIVKSIDDKLQYLYTKEYHEERRFQKFKELKDIGHTIGLVLKRCKRSLESAKMDCRKDLTELAIVLMWECNFRVGNEKYRQMYDSIGTSTICKNHITNKGNYLDINFIGKKGMVNQCKLWKGSTAFHPLIQLFDKANRDEKLFQFRDQQNKKRFISYNDIANYLSEYNIRPKDLRTLQANIHFLKLFKEKYPEEKDLLTSENRVRRFLNTLFDKTSSQLHHTRAICKKSYLHPSFITDKVSDLDKIYDRLNKCKTPAKYFDKFIGT